MYMHSLSSSPLHALKPLCVFSCSALCVSRGHRSAVLETRDKCSTGRCTHERVTAPSPPMVWVPLRLVVVLLLLPVVATLSETRGCGLDTR